jgi:hypothetical protein
MKDWKVTIRDVLHPVPGVFLFTDLEKAFPGFFIIEKDMSLEKAKDAEIHLTLDENGKVVIEAFNVVGPACEALTKPYANLFTVTSTTKKPEYHQHEQHSHSQQVHH